MNITNRKVESNDENAINVLKENHTNNSMEQMLKENLSCEIFHFILNVFYSPHIILKIILAFFILLACSLASYTTITLVLTYMEYNVVTMTRTINETPSVFPKVTICNKNPLTTKYAYEFLSKENLFDSSQINEALNKDRNSAIKIFFDIL